MLVLEPIFEADLPLALSPIRDTLIDDTVRAVIGGNGG
jgi:hypothetical protein